MKSFDITNENENNALKNLPKSNETENTIIKMEKGILQGEVRCLFPTSFYVILNLCTRGFLRQKA